MIKTGTKINVTPMANVDGSNGVNCAEVWASYSHFESSILSLRSSNIHRPGSARASDVWICIPQGPVAPQLVRKLHEGSLEKITVSTFAFLQTAEVDKPMVVSTIEYFGCFIKFVDPISYIHFCVFSFSFSKVVFRSNGYGLEDGDQKGLVDIAKPGTYCYAFDYTGTQGKGNAS
ncbi:hypothetical protein FACS1894113_4340 [Alphaproteobacteria bacterium]|nr:hypothetical protein FACS1894113_4340 [Alphaproteobacteria bacterium]